MQTIFLVFVWLAPFITSGLAFSFHRRQNGQKAWTGGPISKPKSMWLAYTVTNWFFLPIAMLFAGLVPEELFPLYGFHLLSWWIRGPLELVMIYRWKNWTPYYGISHDLFHIGGVSTFLVKGLANLDLAALAVPQKLAVVFAGIILFTTVAEILFAYLFLTTRSESERAENVYFASEDPKWKRVNRITATVVTIAYVHLFAQTLILIGS